MDTPLPSSALTAARIAEGDDRTRYDAVSIALHWLTAALVLGQFSLAETWAYFERPSRHLMIVAHMSFGMLLALVLVLRIAWRVTPGHQHRLAALGWVERASHLVHWALYGLLAASAMLGFVLRWSGGEAMSFFGLLIPPPFAPFTKPAHHWVGLLHDWVGWTIVIVAAGHAAAALLHHYALHDGVLRRMLPGRRAR